MPEQILFTANPPPDPSQLPDEILSFRKELNIQGVLSPDELHAIQQFRKAADFIAAGACFASLILQTSNILLL